MDDNKEKALMVTSRRKVLEELIKMKKATAYDIAKKVGISDAAVGKHLKTLEEAGLVQLLSKDTSTGRLRKLYIPTPNAEETLYVFWEKEILSTPHPGKIQKRILKIVKEEKET